MKKKNKKKTLIIIIKNAFLFCNFLTAAFRLFVFIPYK